MCGPSPTVYAAVIVAAAAVADPAEPLDIARLSMEEKVFVKCRGERQLKGTLHVGISPTTAAAASTAIAVAVVLVSVVISFFVVVVAAALFLLLRLLS